MTQMNIKSAARFDLPPADDLAAMVRASNADQVADDFGCSTSTIYNRLKMAGYTSAGHHKKTKSVDDALPAFQWSTQPWADRALCAETDPEAFIRAWAAANGIDCNPVGRPSRTVVDAYTAAHPGQVAS